ncbi:hypothetical protein HFP15_41550, partial [Amycolatopsis sp. K13G38]|nr:hypothetical protein [Amycolatopsis acididurans]
MAVSPGARPRSVLQVTVPVPAGQFTFSGPWSVCAVKPLAPAAPPPPPPGLTARMPEGRFSDADTGSDVEPPSLRTVIGNETGPPPGCSSTPPGGVVALRLAGVAAGGGGGATGAGAGATAG